MKKRLQRLVYYLCVLCKPHKSRTVRYAFPLAFASLVFLGASVLTSGTASYVKLSSDKTYVKSGEFFTIDVYAGAHIAANAVDIQIAYPEDQIKIEGIDTGTSVITIWTTEPYAEDGLIVLRGGTFRKGFLGEHMIAQINARAKEAGSAKFSADSVQLLAGDGRGTDITIKDTGYQSHTMYVDVTADDKTGEMTIEASVQIAIYTDIDGDGKVDMKDILSFMNAWRDKSTLYDFNGDGKMTFKDFGIILSDSFFK